MSLTAFPKVARYSSINCTGTALFYVGSGAGGETFEFLPPYAYSDGTSIWGPSGAPIIITIGSEKSGNDPYCATYGPGGGGPMILARPAGIIDATPITPPFSLK